MHYMLNIIDFKLYEAINEDHLIVDTGFANCIVKVILTGNKSKDFFYPEPNWHTHQYISKSRIFIQNLSDFEKTAATAHPTSNRHRI